MIQFILGFCLAIAILAILSRQKALKDILIGQDESNKFMQERIRVDKDALIELTRVRLHLSDISDYLCSIANDSRKTKTKKANKP